MNKSDRATQNTESYKRQGHQLQKLKQKTLGQFFPQKPYDTQLRIAQALYESLQAQDKKVMIVESPTGTGKTYALLVGVLAWIIRNPTALNQYNNDQNQGKQVQQESNSIPSWLLGQAHKNKEEKLISIKEQKLKKIKSISEAKEAKNNKFKNVKKDDKAQKLQWEIQDIEDIGSTNPGAKTAKRKNDNFSIMVQQIFSENDSLPKLIFVSRTHSQLSQVMQSIEKMGLPIRYISMASKDHLCTNPQIEKSKVHQKCQYLLSHGGCPHYHQQLITDFLGLRLQQAQSLGQTHSMCAYFALKNLLPVCDTLCLPYASILNPEIRTRLGITLSNAIVVFDQAHNVIEQELGMKSPEINYGELQQLCRRVDEYRGKYAPRMNEENSGLLVHMQEVCRALMTIIRRCWEAQTGQQQQGLPEMQEMGFNKRQAQEKPNYLRMTKVELFRQLKLPQIRVHKMKNYISLSNFDQKLAHFKEQPFPLHILNSFLDFLTLLTTAQEPFQTPSSLRLSSIDPTVILIKNLQSQLKSPLQQAKSPLQSASIKLFSMQSTELAKIAQQSRLTVLAGGTMEPIGELTTIFKAGRIRYGFARGQHVIGQDQCRVVVVGGTQINKEHCRISFTYQNLRNEGKKIMERTARIIGKIVGKMSPGSGMVIFIQNYGLIEMISQCLGKQFQGVPLFYDSPSGASDKTAKQGSIFDQYSHKIKKDKSSAILVSVMGGRLSEGINFSDELARAIVVLGLPYPNIKAPEIVQKMKYLDAKFKSKLQQEVTKKQGCLFESANKKQQKDTALESEQTGQKYYQNCCIRTINQTIGRGIRHINDYADIYLIDSRFAGITHKLSSWLQRRMQIVDFYQC